MAALWASRYLARFETSHERTPSKCMSFESMIFVTIARRDKHLRER